MIRTLQKKFVITAMAAISVLLLVLLLGINITNSVLIRQEAQQMLSLIERSGGQPEAGLKPPALPEGAQAPEFREDGLIPEEEKQSGDQNRFRGRNALFRISADNAMGARFFIAYYEEGESVRTDTSRIFAVTQEEAAAIAEAVYQKNKKEGVTGSFLYRICEESPVTGYFLDVSQQKRQAAEVLTVSALAAAAAWILMLLLVIFLSGRAIRPIAENLEKQKRFVTDAGHEIKTPLAIIMANTEAMEMISGENKWTRNIKAQTMRLSGLMQNLLTLARLDEGVKPDKTDIALSEAVRKTAEDFAESAALKGLMIETSLDESCIVKADRGQLQQLLSILADNAVKYTAQGGTILFEVLREKERVLLRQSNPVQEGALPEDPKQLFDRFYRRDKARTQSAGGYGIGLSAALSIAEANGASISADYPRNNVIRFTVWW